MKNLLVCLILLLMLVNSNNMIGQDSLTSGPVNGTLLVVGGGSTDGIMEKFIEIAGGPDVPIVVIPTAAGRTSYSQDEYGAAQLRQLGAKEVNVMHASSKEAANDPAFIEKLKKAKAIWFGGGRQWRLVDSYAGTNAEQVFWDLLNKGGLIGGSSAGATILGSYLARGDTKNNQIMMGDHEQGFGFVKNIAIDQHVLARNRHFDMFDILKEKPELLGISIDEGTGIIIKGNQFEVIGRSYVIIFDNKFWSREGSNSKTLPTPENRFYFLRSGDEYNMAKRRVIEK